MLAVNQQMDYKNGIKGVEAPSIPNQNEGLVRMARKNVKHLPINIKVPDGAIAIPLSQGKYAIIDAEDFEKVNQWGWSLGYSPNKQVSYAITQRRKDGKVTRYLMHRVIMNAPKGLEVDHINHDGLDNRKSNLRLATRGENLYNSRPPIGRDSKGIWLYRNKWNVTIQRNRKRYYLGAFNTKEEAQTVYNVAAEQLYEGRGYIVPLSGINTPLQDL